jgi:hypothetical protein
LLFAELQGVLTQGLTLALSTVLTGRVRVFTKPFAIAKNGLPENAGDFGLRTIVTCHSGLYHFRFLETGAFIVESGKN